MKTQLTTVCLILDLFGPDISAVPEINPTMLPDDVATLKQVGEMIRAGIPPHTMRPSRAAASADLRRNLSPSTRRREARPSLGGALEAPSLPDLEGVKTVSLTLSATLDGGTLFARVVDRRLGFSRNRFLSPAILLF